MSSPKSQWSSLEGSNGHLAKDQPVWVELLTRLLFEHLLLLRLYDPKNVHWVMAPWHSKMGCCCLKPNTNSALLLFCNFVSGGANFMKQNKPIDFCFNFWASRNRNLFWIVRSLTLLMNVSGPSSSCRCHHVFLSTYFSWLINQSLVGVWLISIFNCLNMIFGLRSTLYHQYNV